METALKPATMLDALCKKHNITSCDIKNDVKQLFKAVKALIRTEGLRIKAELERRET